MGPPWGAFCQITLTSCSVYRLLWRPWLVVASYTAGIALSEIWSTGTLISATCSTGWRDAIHDVRSENPAMIADNIKLNNATQKFLPQLLLSCTESTSKSYPQCVPFRTGTLMDSIPPWLHCSVSNVLIKVARLFKQCNVIHCRLCARLQTQSCLILSSMRDAREQSFASRVSTLTRDINIAILSVRLSICLSVRLLHSAIRWKWLNISS